jgi:hypothetical protein
MANNTVGGENRFLSICLCRLLILASCCNVIIIPVMKHANSLNYLDFRTSY